jgi:hypothetical protein
VPSGQNCCACDLQLATCPGDVSQKRRASVKCSALVVLACNKGRGFANVYNTGLRTSNHLFHFHLLSPKSACRCSRPTCTAIIVPQPQTLWCESWHHAIIIYELETSLEWETERTRWRAHSSAFAPALPPPPQHHHFQFSNDIFGRELHISYTQDDSFSPPLVLLHPHVHARKKIVFPRCIWLSYIIFHVWHLIPR